ncbi:MAG: methylglyoxal synthase [Deferribacteraceae bacterium]|jgi:methylglyoxal synthase|nr:methylglyoxal synthase [Deferribacteraceae bacterium]
MKALKTIGLVAHDNQKRDLVDWVDANSLTLSRHRLVCTGTTGKLVSQMFKQKHPDIDVEIILLKSGPLGGDQQLGAMISNGKVDFIVFLTDPMTMQPHDVDVKALIRMGIIYNVVMACNLTTADFVIASPLFTTDYEQKIQDYSKYITREY